MVFKRLWRWFVNLNLFEDNTALTTLNDQLFTTRLFILLLSISCLIVTLFASWALQTPGFTVASPSIFQFDYLDIVYGQNLVCPCS